MPCVLLVYVKVEFDSLERFKISTKSFIHFKSNPCVFHYSNALRHGDRKGSEGVFSTNKQKSLANHNSLLYCTWLVRS